MLKIARENVVVNGHQFDFELENGVLLHESEFNGEKYIINLHGCEAEYTPVYADEPNENDGYDIIGFEEQMFD